MYLFLDSISPIFNPIFNIMLMKPKYKLLFFYFKYFSKSWRASKFLFDHHFFTNRFYLNFSANEGQMSSILNVSIFELNRITNDIYGYDFNSLCDFYRLTHFWDEFTNPLNAHLPVHSIISSCGFTTNDDFSQLLKGNKEMSRNILNKKFN